MADSDSLVDNSPPDTFNALIFALLGQVHFRLIGIIFIIYLIVSLDVFDNKVMGGLSGTNKGMFVKGLIIVFVAIIADIALNLQLV